MNTKRAAVILTAITALGAGAGVVVGTGAADAAGSAHSSQQVTFSARRVSVHQVDVAPAGPSVGDQTYIGGKINPGSSVSGYTSAQCVQVTPENHGISQCEVDFLLRHGTIVTRGTSTNASSSVRLAVVGGTGYYDGVSGSGTLTPNQTGSTIALTLH